MQDIEVGAHGQFLPANGPLPVGCTIPPGVNAVPAILVSVVLLFVEQVPPAIIDFKLRIGIFLNAQNFEVVVAAVVVGREGIGNVEFTIFLGNIQQNGYAALGFATLGIGYRYGVCSGGKSHGIGCCLTVAPVVGVVAPAAVGKDYRLAVVGISYGYVADHFG